MAIEQLLVRLRLDAGQYKSEARQAATATNQISGAAQQTGTATGKLQAQMSGLATMAKVAVAGAATAAVGSFVSDSVRAFSDLEQSIGGTEAVFGESAGAIEEFADKSAKAIGLSEAQFRTATTLIGGQLKRMTGDVDFAAESSIRLTEIGADLAATYGGTTKEAVDAFAAALRGEADPAERFNLNLKITAVNAKAVELGLAKSTNEVDENARAQALLALVTEQSADAQGQFARETDSVAGSLQIASASFEDFKAQIGQSFAPVVTDATTRATQFLDVWDQDVNLGFTQRLSASLQTVLGDSTEAVQSYIDQKTAINDLAETSDSFAGETNRRGRNAQRDLKEQTDDTTDAIEDQAGAFDENERAIDRTIRMLGDYEDAQRRLTDPVFKAIDDQRNLTQAQLDYNAAVDEFGRESPEAVDAALDLAAAQQDANDSLRDLPGDMQGAIDSIAIFARQAGVAEDTIDALRGNLEDFDGSEFNATVFVNVRGGSRIPGNPNVDVVLRQHGGPLRANQPAIVGEAGPELFIPQTAGTVIPNSVVQSGGQPVGGTTVNNWFTLSRDDFLREMHKAGVEVGRLGWN